MSAFYERMQATAERLLSRYGQDWAITRTTGPGMSVTRTARAVVESVVRYVVPGSGVDIGDKRMLIEADANPIKGERIEAGADRYVIVRVEPLQPAGVTLAWWAWARSG